MTATDEDRAKLREQDRVAEQDRERRDRRFVWRIAVIIVLVGVLWQVGELRYNKHARCVASNVTRQQLVEYARDNLAAIQLAQAQAPTAAAREVDRRLVLAAQATIKRGRPMSCGLFG